MLVVDADKRLSLRGVARHRWLAAHTEHATQPDASIGQCSCHAGSHVPHMSRAAAWHDTVLAHMLALPALTADHVFQSVQEERFDHIYAIYHLLMDKLQQRTSARNSLQHRDSLDSTTGQPLDLTSCKNPEEEQMEAEESTQECLVSIPCVNVDYLTERADSLEKFGDGSAPAAEETCQTRHEEPHAARRHTVGPGDCRHGQGGELGVCGAASADLRAGPLYVSAHFNQQAPANVSLLPNTNLCGKLPAVQHQPPRYFSVKDQHLLKPPHAMQGHASSFGRRASDGGAHVPRGRERACCHSAPAHHASDSGAPARAEDSETSDEHGTDAAYNNNLCRYMLTRGSGKRHTIGSQDDAANAAGNLPSTSPSSTSSIRVRRTGLLTVTERPPVISPELVMEVEARMNRNYLPPSIQGGYQYQGYQNPPTTTTQNVPQSPTQGSITQGTPNYSSAGPSGQKQMVPVLETIPQGSMIGTKGSIMSGTPITTQAASPFTPQLSQYSPTHGAVVQSGSITSGTPVQNQGSIVSGTPMSTSSFDSKNFGNFGSNYSAPNFNTMNTNFSNSNFSGNTNNFGANVGTNNFGTNMSSNPNFGASMSSNNFGTNINSNPNFGTNMNANTNFGANMNTSTNFNVSSNPNFASNFGSITSGTPMNYQNQVQNSTQMQNMPSGSIMAGTPCQNSVSGTNQYTNQGQYNTRQRKYSGPQRVKLQTLATVQEMAREHAERYSPVRRAECSPPRAAHDLASAKLEYQQLQRGLERRSGGSNAGASPPLQDTRLHTPASSMPGSPVAACGVAALDLSLVSPEAARAVLCAARSLRDPAALDLPRTKLLTQDIALKLGINLHTLCLPHVNASQELLKCIHSYSGYTLLSGRASPASPGSPLHQITEGLSYLHTGSITRGTPQASATPLDLRSNVEMDTSQYPQLLPMVHPQVHLVTHRSLNNSPISNPGSPLDMIQEEIGNGSHNADAKLFSQDMTRHLQHQFQNYASTHPQISLTDCLGSEITLVASSSEDSMDSLENTKYSLPQFVISEPSDLDDRPSITKGIGRKVSQESEPPPPVEIPKEVDKDTEMESPKETPDDTNKFLSEDLKYPRRGSDKSLGFSDDSLSNDSANVSPNCEQNVQSIYSNIVSISSGFSENRGSFSEHRESFSFSDRGSFSERGDFGRSSFSERSDFGRGSFSEKGETPRSSFSAQGTLGEVKEYYEDVYMPRDPSRHCLEKCDEESPQGTEEIEKLQRSTMDLRLTEICRPEEQKIPILLSPQKVSCVQEYYEVTLSTVCSKLDSQSIVELLKEAINTRVPPQNIFVETNGQNDSEDEALTGFLNLEYSGGIQIELVVCENKAKEKKGLKMRRISGDQREYGKLCQQLITSLTVKRHF
ncbi:uncharacterized protein LOC114352724 isoform X4 [Ostrinia furnacalis]|uniref:uncharacterized protein LOC114352724 isoform X3 n=1 Tax=Ostrinia furnacalis TaxID=93504 RepID=UPI00103AA4A6|nr:uncharacterized protein LOC114352724 isoform X3 [Ostrinia furnacalis]XP_028160217.1 uncharacterized protein LOC114352724 isoform X4 [Ostrinia furnacalis]